MPYYRKQGSTTVVNEQGIEVPSAELPQNILADFSSVPIWEDQNQNKVPRYAGPDEVTEYYKRLDITAPTAGEEAGIREEERKYIQSQIDYIEQQYGKAVTGEEAAGKERYGRTRAILSAGGLLGTPMGGTAKEQTKQYTTENLRLLGEEKVTKINILLDKADKTALDRIDKEKTLARTNQQAYICLLYTSPSPRDGLLSRMPSSA